MPEAHELELARASFLLEGNHGTGVYGETHRRIGRQVWKSVYGVDVHASSQELADQHAAALHGGLLVTPAVELLEEVTRQLDEPWRGGALVAGQGMRRLKMARPAA